MKGLGFSRRKEKDFIHLLTISWVFFSKNKTQEDYLLMNPLNILICLFNMYLIRIVFMLTELERIVVLYY